MENKRVEPKTIAGFMELLPNEQILFNQMMDTIKKSYESFGFLPIDTPIIEYSDVLLAKAGGETEKQIYRFEKGENDLSLRFDLTVPLAKYVSEYYGNLSFPFRRYQIGKVYRGEKPQRGRYREFYQCDIDIIGDGEISVINEAEMPAVIYKTFKNLGFDNFTIYMNNRKILNGLFESLGLKENAADVMRIIDKFDKIGEDGVKAELTKIEVDDSALNKIIEFILITGTTDEKVNALKNINIENDLFKEGVSELETVVSAIKMFGVPDEYFTIDLKIARGLDYYTGTVYETLLNDYKSLGSICSGGRYDNLAEFYTDKKLPGVGISIGLTRLFFQLNEAKLIKAERNSIAKLLVISMDDDINEALKVSSEIRDAGIQVEVYVENKKPKAKMKYADKLAIPYILIIGEEERKTKIYTLKNMQTGEQEKLSVDAVIEKLK